MDVVTDDWLARAEAAAVRAYDDEPFAGGGSVVLRESALLRAPDWLGGGWLAFSPDGLEAMNAMNAWARERARKAEEAREVVEAKKKGETRKS